MTFRRMFPSTDDAEVRTHVGGRRTKTIATPKNVHLLVFLVVVCRRNMCRQLFRPV